MKLIFCALVAQSDTSKPPQELVYKLAPNKKIDKGALKPKTLEDYEIEAARLALGLKNSRIGAQFIGAVLFAEDRPDVLLLALDKDLKSVEPEKEKAKQ